MAAVDVFDIMDPGPLTELLWTLYEAEDSAGPCVCLGALSDLVAVGERLRADWLPRAETVLSRCVSGALSDDEMCDLCHDLTHVVKSFDMHEVPEVLARYFPDLTPSPAVACPSPSATPSKT